MLNTAPDTRATPPMFGFINRPETPSLLLSDAAPEAQSDFSTQLGALMMAEYQKGNLDLAALSDLKKVDPQSLQAFAEKLSFDVDLESDESMFEQLSSWLAQQGLATSFTGDVPQSLSVSEGADAELVSELADLDAMLDTTLEQQPGLVAVSEALEDVPSDELTPQVLSELNERFDELKASMQSMLAALKDAETPEQKHLAVAEFNDSLQQFVAFLKQEKPSVKFELDMAQSQGLKAQFELDPASDDSPLLTDFIQKHLLPRAQKLLDSVSADQANLAGLRSVETEFSDLDGLETLEALTELLSSDALAVENLSEEDLARLEEIVGFVQTLQIPSQLNEVINQPAPAVKADDGKELLNPDLEMNLLEAEEGLNSALNQASAFTPVNSQAAQQAAPQGLAGMAQAALNRQAQPANPNALADKVQLKAATNEATSKPLNDIQAPVQTSQQQLNQSNLQQQAMNLNLKDQWAQQQQEALKVSDVKYKAANAEGELELLGVASTGAERKSSAPALASIAYPLRHPQWAQSVGKRIVFMANQQMQQAQISLNPEKLGPIQLRLQLDRDQMVTVSMTAQHGATREALEAAIPRLKEMLEEAGISFDEVKVEDEDAFEQSNQDQTAESAKTNAASVSNTASEGEVESPSVKKQTDNMIDFYA
ncbi:MAG TPA: flagellar hook-length control protein FliK [Thiomicrospira sp.]